MGCRLRLASAHGWGLNGGRSAAALRVRPASAQLPPPEIKKSGLHPRTGSGTCACTSACTLTYLLLACLIVLAKGLYLPYLGRFFVHPRMLFTPLSHICVPSFLFGDSGPNHAATAKAHMSTAAEQKDAIGACHADNEALKAGEEYFLVPTECALATLSPAACAPGSALLTGSSALCGPCAPHAHCARCCLPQVVEALDRLRGLGRCDGRRCGRRAAWADPDRPAAAASPASRLSHCAAARWGSRKRGLPPGG